MPSGYRPALRAFAKIMKQPFRHLRSLGHVTVIFVDDSCLFGETFSECHRNVHVTLKLLEMLGFTIHPGKSVLIPTQILVFLGTQILVFLGTQILVFLGLFINSIDMSVSLTQDKRDRIPSLTSQLLKNENLNIREVATFIGLLVSWFPGIQFGPLYYRYLGICKNMALSLAEGNFHSPVQLGVSAISELDWWAENMQSVPRPIKTQYIDLLIYSDASLEGWGGTVDIETVGGRWSDNEMF